MGTNRQAAKLLTVIGALLALSVVIAAPALAHHKDDHEQGRQAQQDVEAGGGGGDHDGDADSDPTTTQTEATNTEDAGDNQHPSRKDRSVENTWGSDSNPNQGKSESDPDDPTDGRGPTDRCEDDGDGCGIDKPNTHGGTDEADQDGNNGCGNDDDFDDDNNGWCGKPSEDTPPAVTTTVGGVVEEVADDTVVKGRVDAALPAEDVLGIRLTATPEVAAAAATRPATLAGAALPFTGTDLIPIALIGLGFIGTGGALVRRK